MALALSKDVTIRTSLQWGPEVNRKIDTSKTRAGLRRVLRVGGAGRLGPSYAYARGKTFFK